MKVTRQVNMDDSCHGQQHRIATMLHRAQSFSKHKSSLNNFSMSDCYEKLIEIVPTIPRDRKVSRVEILQHVIDYIQDLQIALDHQHIRVRNINQTTSGHTTLITTSSRTPFSTLQTTSSASGSTQLPLLVTSSETSSLNREFVKQITCSMGQKLHPYDTPESSPESQPCTC